MMMMSFVGLVESTFLMTGRPKSVAVSIDLPEDDGRRRGFLPAAADLRREPFPEDEPRRGPRVPRRGHLLGDGDLLHAAPRELCRVPLPGDAELRGPCREQLPQAPRRVPKIVEEERASMTELWH
eukprot:7691051-Pyramimonas_sp.AAC.1